MERKARSVYVRPARHQHGIYKAPGRLAEKICLVNTDQDQPAVAALIM